MSTAEKKMKDALTEWVVPHLQKRGFRGVFPTLRRCKSDRVDIITFQFTAFDKAFCVNIANCSSEGVTFRSGEYVPAEHATVHHCPQTLKLGTTGSQRNHWFKYDPTPHEIREKNRFPFLSMYSDSLLKYKNIADDIIKLIDTQAEKWWIQSEAWWLSKVPEYNRLFLSIQNEINVH